MRAAAREGAPSLEGDLSQLKANATRAAAKIDRCVQDAVAAEPIVAVGAAAGLGFLIGGGVSRASIKGLAGIGARMVGAWLAKEFLERPPTQE
jgi:hypothetical protein